MHALRLVLTYDLLEDRHIDDVIIKTFLILYDIKPIDSKLLCICSVIHHRGRQNVVRTSVTHSAAPRVPLFCSYHILTSSVIYYWTDAWQLGIYLLNWLSEMTNQKIIGSRLWYTDWFSDATMNVFPTLTQSRSISLHDPQYLSFFFLSSFSLYLLRLYGFFQPHSHCSILSSYRVFSKKLSRNSASMVVQVTQ